jgi:hypothetical protein
MKTYSKETNIQGTEIIICQNEDGSVTSFLADPANSDYQQYLNPKVFDEASTL